MDMVKPISLADTLEQWGRINSNQQSATINALSARQALDEAPMQAKLQEAQLKRYTQQNELGDTTALEKKAALFSNVSKMVVSRAEAQAKQLGIQEGTPEYQDIYNKTAQPLYPLMSQAFGHQINPNDPVDINALKTFSQISNANEYHPPVATNLGTLQYGQNGWEPIRIDNEVAMPVGGDIYLQEQLARAKKRATESEAIVKVTGPDARDRYMKKPQAAGIADNVTEMDEVEAKALLMQAREKNPDIAGRDAARARLMTISQNSEPVVGPTPGEVEAGKQSAKNDADSEKDRKERMKSVQNVLELITQKLSSGKSVEDTIRESTGSGMGNDIDNAIGYFGLSTGGADAISELTPIQEWATSLVPRMQGPQSNFDVERYKAMAGNIANPNITVSKRLKSYTELVFMLNNFLKNEEKNNAEITSPEKIDSVEAKQPVSSKLPNFRSKGEVKGAVQAGVITKSQAIEILKSQFGMED